MLSSAGSFAPLFSVAMSVLGTFATDSTTAVSASQWRLVGRSVASDWHVAQIGFYADAACTGKIPVTARRGKVDSRFYNGRAFAGPVRRGPVDFIAADAFEDNGVTWRSTMPCDDISDLCHIGFDWTTERSVVESGPESAYRSSGRLSHHVVAPHCVKLTQ